MKPAAINGPIHPFYTYPIGDGLRGFWLIRKDVSEPDKWLAVMCPVEGRKDPIAFFDFPEKAAQDIAHFTTGNPQWDSTKELFGWTVENSTLGDLKTWEKHDEGNAP